MTRIRQRFANAARFHDFTAKDIYAPEAERTRAIFSAFINFVKFCEQCEAFISGLRERSATVIEERDRVAQQLVETKQKIAAIKCVRCCFAHIIPLHSTSPEQSGLRTSPSATNYDVRTPP